MREALIKEVKLKRFTLEETRELIEVQAQELPRIRKTWTKFMSIRMEMPCF